MLPMEKALCKPLLADFVTQGSESNEDGEDGNVDLIESDDSEIMIRNHVPIGKSHT